MKKEKPTLTELIWLFIIGCIFGFILEIVWYFIKHGVWLRKQGLLYGPFQPIYGLGLVLTVVVMSRFKDASILKKYVIGVILGSAYEFLSSVFQEYILKTETWNYSAFKFNIGGRIYLPYCLIWGLIGVVCIDYLYPYMKKLIKKIAPKVLKIVTIIVSILMSINIILTVVVTARYSYRTRVDTTSEGVFKIIDKIYDEEYMKKKFPKLIIINK